MLTKTKVAMFTEPKPEDHKARQYQWVLLATYSEEKSGELHLMFSDNNIRDNRSRRRRRHTLIWSRRNSRFVKSQAVVKAIEASSLGFVCQLEDAVRSHLSEIGV